MSSNLDLGFSEVNLKVDKSAGQKVYEFDDFRFDAEHLMLYRRDEELSLAPKAAETLLALIERRGEIVTKDELIERIWPDAFVEESNLFLYLSVLRKTLGNQRNGSPYVETLRRRGYRFNGGMRSVPEETRDGHYAWIVDHPGQDGANLETQSGPIYVVKGWNRSNTESGTTRSQSSALPALKPDESLDVASDPALAQSLLDGQDGMFLSDPHADPPRGAILTLEIKPTEDLSPPRKRLLSSRRFRFAVLGVTAAVAFIAGAYAYFAGHRPIDSIAVMPFVNERGEPAVEDLCDGMTDALINDLSKIPGLQVQARSSVFRYKGKDTDPREIGKELNVRATLHGRLIQQGEDLTLKVELVDAQSGSLLWERSYSRKTSNLLGLQREFVRDLVGGLRIRLSGSTEQKLTKDYTQNNEAYRLYLEAQPHINRLSQSEVNKGIEYLDQAIGIDPSYAIAYAAMARARIALALGGEMLPDEMLKAKSAALKAIELDDSLADGHSALGSAIFFYDWNLKEAENHFLRSLELDPNNSNAHRQYGDFLSKTGRPKDAAAEFKLAREIEPQSAIANTFGAFITEGDDAALNQLRFAIDLDPTFYMPHLMAGEIYGKKGMDAECFAELRLAKSLAPDQTWTDVSLVRLLKRTNRLEEARAVLDELLLRAKTHFVPPFHFASIYNQLGETDKALSYLEEGLRIRDPKMVFLIAAPGWNSKFKDDPRFIDIKQRAGF